MDGRTVVGSLLVLALVAALYVGVMDAAEQLRAEHEAARAAARSEEGRQ